MTPDTAKLQGQTVRRWLHEARKVNGHKTEPGMRSWRRRPWSTPLVIQADQTTGQRILHAVSHDVSPAGVGALCPDRIPTATPVRIWADGEEHGVTGRVMHSAETPQGWHVGIAFDAPV